MTDKQYFNIVMKLCDINENLMKLVELLQPKESAKGNEHRPPGPKYLER